VVLPPVVSSLLPSAIQSLLKELVAQPLPVSGTQGSFIRVTSSIRSSSSPDVLVHQKTCSSPPPLVLPPTPAKENDPQVYTLPLPPSNTSDLGEETLSAQQPTTCVLHLPGRPLTRADFSPSQTLLKADLPTPTPENATSDYRRFIPKPLILPIDESRFPSIGIWPSAPARKWASLECYVKLLPTRPGSLRHGLNNLHSTEGPLPYPPPSLVLSIMVTTLSSLYRSRRKRTHSLPGLVQTATLPIVLGFIPFTPI